MTGIPAGNVPALTDPEYERRQVADSFLRNGRFMLMRGPRPEKDVQNLILDSLKRLFGVKTQVYGTSATGKRLRLDAVLRPRDPGGWYDPAPVFGIEFKRLLSTKYESLNKYTRWAAQSADSAFARWDGYGRLTVFTCPPVTSGCPYLDDVNEFFMGRLLGQFGVGELGIVPECGWTLRLSGENYWTEAGGMCSPRSLIPQEGSSR